MLVVTDERKLRDEFELLLLSPRGYHQTAAECACYWDTEAARVWNKADFDLNEHIALATRWLKTVKRRKTVNPIDTSDDYRHMVEDWCGEFVLHGCFVMAALRLGFVVQPMHGDSEARLNISLKSMPRTWRA